mmetsp:Transcript_3201/g.4386  ORF Transcript_3201/g.4386 Transcript_3201/m.4386 type:complete len:95 (-) Transcript_3201:121-405(-)
MNDFLSPRRQDFKLPRYACCFIAIIIVEKSVSTFFNRSKHHDIVDDLLSFESRAIGHICYSLNGIFNYFLPYANPVIFNSYVITLYKMIKYCLC